MGVVHPACVSLGKDDVVWLWHASPWGLGVSGVYCSLRWSFHFLRVSISCASTILDFTRSSKYHLDFSSFKCMAGISHNLWVFYLHGQALLATRLMFAYGLATTLGVVVHCNTAIRLESVRCVVVAYSVKYVNLLATTLGVAIHCNTAIRLKSVCYTLKTCGQVFVCCSATTLCITIHCDTVIRLKFVRCVLAVIRLLPICRARLR